MKSYTDLEQSKHLAEILPIESADLMWEYEPHKDTYSDKPTMIPNDSYIFINDIPCWSLAVLLEIIKKLTTFYLLINSGGYRCHCRDKYEGKFYDTDDYYDTSIDACYEMIIKLHEQKLL